MNTPTLASRNFRAAKFTTIIATGLVAAIAALSLGGSSSAAVNCATLSGASVDLTGCDLTGADLTGLTTSVKLVNANIKNATLPSKSLASWVFTGVRSGGVKGTPTTLPANTKLTGGYLVGPDVNLKGANLAGVDLTGTSLSNVISGGITGTPTNIPSAYGGVAGLSQYKILGGFILGPYSNLNGETLKGINLTGVNLFGATMIGLVTGTLTGTPTALPNYTVLTAGRLIGPGVNLSGANLAGADMADAAIYGATSGGVTGTPVSLPASTKLVGGYLLGPAVDLTNVTLTGVRLDGVSLQNANLTGLKSSGLTGSPTLTTGTKIIGGRLIGPGVNLSNTNLTGVELKGVTLNGTNFTGATMTNVKSSQITFASLTAPTLPSGWKLVGVSPNAVLVGPGADLSGVTLTNPNLDGVDLTGATLKGMRATATGSFGTVTLPAGWKSAGVDGAKYLIGPGAAVTCSAQTSQEIDTSGASLAGANISYCALPADPGALNLSNATLNKVRIDGVDLSKANVTGLKLSEFSGVPTLPTDWKKYTKGTSPWDGLAIGPGANLGGLALTGLDLSSQNLNDVRSGTTTGTPTLATGWKLVGGYLMGPGANLTGAVLTAGDISKINLTGATLTGLQTSNLSAYNGAPTLPTGWKFLKGVLWGPGSAPGIYVNTTLAVSPGLDLGGVDLTGALLTNILMTNITGTLTALPLGAQLLGGSLFATGVDIAGMSIAGLDLSGVNLTGIKSAGNSMGVYKTVTGTPKKLPPNWKLIKGILVGPGANLAQADLTKADLTSVNLTGANLYGTLLSGANLTKANLSGAKIQGDLTRANLTAANLSGANINGAQMSLTNLSAANLTGASFGSQYASTLYGAVLTGANITNADMHLVYLNPYCPDDTKPTVVTRVKTGGLVGTPATYPGDGQAALYSLYKGYLAGPGMNLASADLSNADLSGISLKDADVTGTKLAGANLIGTDTTHVIGKPASLPTDADLVGDMIIARGVIISDTLPTGANLANTNLRGVQFKQDGGFGHGVRSGGIVGVPSGGYAGPNGGSFTAGSWFDRYAIVGGFIFGRDVNLSNANLSTLDVSSFGATLIGANFTNANLAGTKLDGTELGGGTAEDPNAGTILSNIKGTPASLPQGAKQLGTSIFCLGANLAAAKLSKADLREFNLSNMGFVGADLSGANLAGVNLTNSDLTGANLTGADLSGADLTNAKLTNAKVGAAKLGTATLTGIKSGGITGTPTSIPAALKIQGGFLFGPGVNLNGANLAKLKLTGLNLDGASIEGATMTGLSSSGITGQINTGSDRRLINGHIVGPGVDLSKVLDLNGQDLSGIDLTGATVTGADLGGVNLTKAKPAKLVGTPKALPTGYKLIGGFIVGPKVDLSGQTLSKLILTAFDLTEVDFRNANLTGAKLNGAIISGANFGREDSYDSNQNQVDDSATLTGLIASGVSGEPQSMPHHWIVAGGEGGVIVGPGANLTGVDFKDYNLSNYYSYSGYTNVDLTGTTLAGAIFLHATLPYSVPTGGFTKIVGTPKSLPAGWKLKAGVLNVG